MNDGHCGGETVFYRNGDLQWASTRVAPTAGAALCFPHGSHPLSPLHEGAPLRGGAKPKYVIRTEVMYATTEAPQKRDAQWSSSNYAAAMLRASRAL